MKVKSSQSWQLILADLSLILFLVALTGLASAQARRDSESQLHVQPAQALYRPSADGPELNEWLARQDLDPRLTLTVFVRYRRGNPEVAWSQARTLELSAHEAGVQVRIIMISADEDDIYASLAFDSPG